MASVAEHISTIRNLIKQVQNDSSYTDSFLFSILYAAASSIAKQRLNKGDKLSQWMYQDFCIEMIQTLNHNCSCIPYGCDVTRSRHRIPEPISTMTNDLIVVKTLQGKRLSQRTQNQISSDQYDPIRKSNLSFFVNDKYIYLNKPSHLKVLVVSGIWADPSELLDIQYCNEEGLPDCQTVYDLSLPISPDDTYAMYSMSMNLLQLPMQVAEDITSDANPEIKA